MQKYFFLFTLVALNKTNTFFARFEYKDEISSNRPNISNGVSFIK